MANVFYRYVDGFSLSSCKKSFEALNVITNSMLLILLTKGDGADSNVSFDFLPAFSSNEIEAQVS
jgi:hypothetical protein